MCRLQAGPSAPQTTFEVMLGALRQWVDLYNTAVVPKQVSVSLHATCPGRSLCLSCAR